MHFYRASISPFLKGTYSPNAFCTICKSFINIPNINLQIFLNQLGILLILYQILLNLSDLRIFLINLAIFLNELGIFEIELVIFVNEHHLSIKCSITTNEKIKDPCRENLNLSFTFISGAPQGVLHST